MTEIEILTLRRGETVSFGWSPIRWLRAAVERRRQRRALAMLGEHLLRDIGLTREQALAEARRPPWR